MQWSILNFAVGYYVLLSREDFSVNEKLSLCWRGPRRIIKSLSNFISEVENLRTGQVDEAHIDRLKYYHDGSLDQEFITSHLI